MRDPVDVDAETLAMIERYGVAVTSVAPRVGETGTPFSHTIGLTALGQPEVVVVGLGHQVGHYVCNEVHQRVRDDGLALAPGVVLPGMLGGDGEYAAVLCAVSDEHEAYRIADFYAHYALLQVVYPDFGHRFPWDDGYDFAPDRQGDWFVRPA